MTFPGFPLLKKYYNAIQRGDLIRKVSLNAFILTDRTVSFSVSDQLNTFSNLKSKFIGEFTNILKIESSNDFKIKSKKSVIFNKEPTVGNVWHRFFQFDSEVSSMSLNPMASVDNEIVQLMDDSIDASARTEVMKNGECKATVYDRLLHMMEMSRVVISDVSGLAKFSHVLKVSQHRANAIKWIKDVVSLSHVSVETRDSSIQIFDRFLGVCLSENKNILGHSTDVALAAAVSVLLASKLHETRPLSMSSFPHLKTNDLVAFERLVMSKLGFALYPLASPAAFIRYLLSVWTDGCECQYLNDTACNLVGDFFEAPEAPHFAPSAIALSALLLSFSKLGMDCTEWLEHVPNICLPSPLHPIYNTQLLVSFLDVDNCLSVFQRLQASQTMASRNNFSSIVPQTPFTTPQTEERLISPNSVVDNVSPSKPNQPIVLTGVSQQQLEHEKSSKVLSRSRDYMESSDDVYSQKKFGVLDQDEYVKLITPTFGPAGVETYYDDPMTCDYRALLPNHARLYLLTTTTANADPDKLTTALITTKPLCTKSFDLIKGERRDQQLSANTPSTNQHNIATPLPIGGYMLPKQGRLQTDVNSLLQREKQVVPQGGKLDEEMCNGLGRYTSEVCREGRLEAEEETVAGSYAKGYHGFSVDKIWCALCSVAALTYRVV
eukprot:gene7183-14638_t